MSQKQQESCHSSVCGLDLTLPLDFVREWVSLTTKQHWTAKVKDCEVAYSDVPSTEAVSPDQTTAENEILPVHEMDMSVMTDVVCKQKTYLYARITGVRFCMKEGRLQLSIVDVKADSCDTNTGLVSPDDADPQNPHTPQTCRHSQAASANCADQAVCKTVPEFNTQPDIEPCAKSSLVSCRLATHGTCRTSKSDIRDVETCAESSKSVSGIPVEVNQTTRQLVDDGKQKRNTTKRKRGRPHKSMSSPHISVHSASSRCKTSADLAGPTPSSAELKPTTIGHYSLRGKKLPSSIFEESGSEREEDDDYEYRPPLMKFVRLRSLKTEEEMKGEPSDSGERVSENSKDPTDRLEANNHNVTESDLSKEFALRQPKESVNKDHTNLKALPQPSHKRKRGRPCRLAGDEYSYTAGREQSTKKKRLKIDVTGLPSFTRRKRNKERKATCKYCRRKFCDFTGVTVHVKKFHSKEDDLGEYLQDLKQLSVMKCSICHKEFDNRFQLQLHEDKTHFKTGELPCRQCGKMFSNMVLVKQHIRSVHQVQGQKHACTQCPAKFKWATTLKTHIAEVHQGIRDLECNVCGKKFNRQSQLNRHIIIHGPEEAKLVCKLCGRKFWYPSNLQRHMSIVHGPYEEAWHCAYCGKGFQRKESLHNHVEKLHFSMFPYHCSICRAGFVRAVLLEKHMATEHSLLNFQAPAGRRPHFKYNRSEEDELSCGMCDSKFFYKSQLVQHVFNSHSDAFPFHCDVCQQVFLERPFLVLHQKRAHAIEPALEDMEFGLEDNPPGQQSTPISGSLCGKPSRKKSSLSQSARKKSKYDVEERGELVMGDNSYIIKVENGNTTIQYVIQNPDGDHSAPSDSVVQDIANLLLAAEQSVQEGTVHEATVVTTASGASLSGVTPPQAVVMEPGSVHNLPEDVTVQGDEGLDSGSADPLQGLTVPQRIIVQCGEHTSIHEIVPNTDELEVESNCERSAQSQDGVQDLNFLTSLLASDTGDAAPQRILVAGGNIIHNFTVSSDTASAEHVTDVNEQPTSVNGTGCTEENIENAGVYVTLDTIPTASVVQQGAMETASSCSGDQIVAMETVLSSSGVQHMAVNRVPESVVLDGTGVFGHSGFNQQIIVTATSVDEGGNVILSAAVEQDEQVLDD